MNKPVKIIQKFKHCLPLVGSYSKTCLLPAWPSDRTAGRQVQRLSSVANQHLIFELRMVIFEHAK
ncbi:MAG: hypothetical protein M0Q90_15805 [Bacteroidales bacterium]|nr:hypothetical protein [Bacteroidales bacterium]